MEVGEPGFEHERVLEASGLICYDQNEGLVGVGFLYHVGLSNKFLKLYIWQRLFIASSVGSELKSPNRRLSYFDEK